MQRIRLLVLVIALLLGVGVVAFLINQNSSTRAQDGGPQLGDPWPRFVMVFQDASYNLASGQVAAYDTYRYTYGGVKNWRLELTGSTRDARMVGTWQSYDGTFYRYSVYGDGHPGPEHTDKADHPVMATSWLIPVSPSLLGMDGKFRRVSADSTMDQVHLRREEDLPCSPLSAPLKNQFCRDGRQSYKQVTDKLLTADYGIPTEITEQVEGRVTSRITVKELTYNK